MGWHNGSYETRSCDECTTRRDHWNDWDDDDEHVPVDTDFPADTVGFPPERNPMTTPDRDLSMWSLTLIAEIAMALPGANDIVEASGQKRIPQDDAEEELYRRTRAIDADAARLAQPAPPERNPMTTTPAPAADVPAFTVRFGGLPEILCYTADRAEGRVPRFTIPDEHIMGVTGTMLVAWLGANGLGGPGAAAKVAWLEAAFTAPPVEDDPPHSDRIPVEGEDFVRARIVVDDNGNARPVRL